MISDKDILSLYEAVLPLVYHNPENKDLYQAFSKKLDELVTFDFSHYMMMEQYSEEENFRLRFEKWMYTGAKEYTDIGVSPTIHPEPDTEFGAEIERNYAEMIRRVGESRPGKAQEYHYHRITTFTKPEIAIGFFRYKSTEDNAFSENEIAQFDRLAPHIFHLVRIILVSRMHSQAYHYFNSYTQICSRIAFECHLTDTEAKFVPDILFGYSNEQIAERRFVSLPTVKKHLKNIFRKTSTKNRIDFIGRFFTSPDRIDI